MKPNSASVRVPEWIFGILLVWVVLAGCGCHTLGFYGQAIKGQCQILSREKPTKCLLADPQTPARLKHQLELVERLRGFAAAELKLPVDKQYLKYADLGRPYVVWNVEAAPEFSLQPKKWWYPLVGSLQYRGYFSKCGAEDCARRWRDKGYDTCVEGVEAYSTLGWFKDPVLNTFVYEAEPELAEVIFHELGHQRLFVPGDTDFNEAFATTVGQAGARRWLRAEGNTNRCRQYIVALRRNNQFVRMILRTRRRLEQLYGDTIDKDGNVKAAKQLPASPGCLRSEKARAFEALRREYAALKSKWGGYSGYDQWFDHELNNARLNSIANYYEYLPGFKRLLALNGGNLEKFYEAVQKLSRESREKRRQRLRELGAEEPSNPAASKVSACGEPKPAAIRARK